MYVTSSRCSAIIDSGGAKFEGIEELLDLESSAPYKVDCTWSKEGAALRKIVIENPECLNDRNFVWKHFKTLRIVNENVILSLLFFLHKFGSQFPWEAFSCIGFACFLTDKHFHTYK